MYSGGQPLGLGELSKGMLGEEVPGSLLGVTSAFLPSSKTGSFGGREKAEGCNLEKVREEKPSTVLYSSYICCASRQ